MLLELRLKRIRIKEQNKLNSTNLYLYKSITAYIKNSNLRKIEKEEILQQIMDMLLEAQAESKDIKKIIGDDYKEFCQSIILEYEANKNKTYRLISYVQRYLTALFIISFLIWLIGGDISNYFLDFKITLDGFIMANIVALILVPASKKENQKSPHPPSAITLWQRIHMVGRSKSWIFLISLIAFKEIILKAIIDPNFFYQLIPLNILRPAAIVTILIIITIEIYKRVSDRDFSS